MLELGAERFVDLEQARWEDAVGQTDPVYDTICGEVQSRSMGLVKTAGALVTVIAPPPDSRPDIRVVNFVRDPNRAQPLVGVPSRRRHVTLRSGRRLRRQERVVQGAAA